MHKPIGHFLLLASFLVLEASAAPKIPPYEGATQHYRSSERFDHVAVDVLADQSSALQNEGLTDLADSLTDELIVYLGNKGIFANATIGFSADDAAAQLAVRVFRDHVRAAARHTASATYRLEARLVDPGGNLLDETTLYHRSGDSSATATAQQLAMLVADDMLLMWHPAASVVGEEWPRPKPAPFTLLANDFDTGAKEPLLSWESFPSERLLAGADFSAEDITDVSYELRVHRPGPSIQPKIYYTDDGEGVPVPTSAVRARSGIFQVRELAEPQYAVSFSFPSCEFVSWSVRANFRLHGHPRVTEWAGNYSTVFKQRGRLPIPPPYFFRREDYSPGILEHQIGGGTLVAIEPPASIRCKELGFGWIIPQKQAKTKSQLRLEPLEPDESIAAIAMINDVCTAGDCEIRASEQEASEKLAECLTKEFKRRSFDTQVHDMSKILSELPTPPDPDSNLADSTALLTHLRLPENRDYLGSRGIRYIIGADMSLHQDAGSWELEFNQPDFDEIILEENYESTLPVGAIGKETQYISSMDSNVIDISNGEIVGTIISSAEGSKGAFVPVIVIVPVAYIPYGSRAKIEAKACDQMARRLSVTLRGAISGWPNEYFKDVYEPLWK